MQFLVIDDRSGRPVHVFLRSDPAGADGYPGLPVFPVTLDRPPAPAGPAAAVGRHVGYPGHYREFRAEPGAGDFPFVPVGACYIGPAWADYDRDARPDAA